MHTASLTFSNSTFCSHTVFVCFVWISEQTAIISLYNINWLVFITQTQCVYCAVRTGSLNVIEVYLVCTVLPHSQHTKKQKPSLARKQHSHFPHTLVRQRGGPITLTVTLTLCVTGRGRHKVVIVHTIKAKWGNNGGTAPGIYLSTWFI